MDKKERETMRGCRCRHYTDSRGLALQDRCCLVGVRYWFLPDRCGPGLERANICLGDPGTSGAADCRRYEPVVPERSTCDGGCGFDPRP